MAPDDRVPATPPQEPDRPADPATDEGSPRPALLAPGQLFFGGLLLLGVGVVIVLIRPELPGALNLVVRVVVGLGAALVASVIPGQLGVQTPVVKAGGAIGVFAIVFFFTPGEFPDAERISAAIQDADSARAVAVVDDISRPEEGDTSRVVVDTSTLGDLDSATASAVGAIVDSLGTATPSGGISLPRAVLQQQLQVAADRPETSALRADSLYRVARSTKGIAKKHVLWIDDRPEGNASLVKLFESMGMEVTQVTTDRAAKQALADGGVNVVISDVGRNDRPQAGLEFLSSLRNTPHPPFVFYVGLVRRSYGVPPDAIGITSSPNELVDLVLKALDTGS